MERKFLEELGLEKESIEKIMAQNGKDIESYKTSAETVTAERDSLKGQLETVQEALKKFDGVDVDALKGEIETLKTDLTAKEAEFTGQIAERDFNATLDAEIMAAKGKNPKAIKALLDMDALKSSKNQKEDTAAAIKAVAESDAYLFGGEQESTPAKVNTGGEHNEPNEPSTDPFIAGAMKGAGLTTGKDE